jgi:hypothetical protein
VGQRLMASLSLEEFLRVNSILFKMCREFVFIGTAFSASLIYRVFQSCSTEINAIVGEIIWSNKCKSFGIFQICRRLQVTKLLL